MIIIKMKVQRHAQAFRAVKGSCHPTLWHVPWTQNVSTITGDPVFTDALPVNLWPTNRSSRAATRVRMQGP